MTKVGQQNMAKLYIIRGTEKGRSFDLKGDNFYVGRAPDNQVQIKHRSISRKHLRIFMKTGKFFVEDLKTTNGTLLNGEWISPGVAYEVKEGHPIGIGSVVICLQKQDKGDATAILDAGRSSQKPVQEGRSPQDARHASSRNNMELIYKVCKLLMQSSDLNDILDKVLSYIFDLLRRIERGFIILVDTETGEVSKVISKYRRREGRSNMIYSRAIVSRVLREGKAIVMPDTNNIDEAKLSSSLRSMRIRSVMCIPLISRSRVRGVIYVDSLSRAHAFRNEDLPLLTALSTPAALAIENAFLYSTQ